MPSSPSIFDRLSQQGTSASKQRDAEEKQSRLKNEQRRQKETAALTPTKNNIDRKLQARQARETGICPIREELYS